jgi:protein arginine kinase activator
MMDRADGQGKPTMQLCDQCGKNAANVHVTQIAPNGTTVSHLCEECARGHGIDIKIGMGGEQDEQQAAIAQPERTCGRCGLSLSTFREQGRLGCAACYESFGEEIDKMLKELHGSCVHRGKRYSRIGSVKGSAEDIARLRGELDRAVINEDFEEAARLRDTISALSAQGEPG